MQSIGDEGAPESSNGSITIPPLPGTVGHLRQKPSRIALGDRQHSYDTSTFTSSRTVPRSNPSPPPLLHHRQYSEGAGAERSTSALMHSGRNASVSSLDTYPTFGTLNGSEVAAGSINGRRRHGHSHSHAHSHHHHPSHASPVPSKPASVMSMRLMLFSS
jgi:hypothetical protein